MRRDSFSSAAQYTHLGLTLMLVVLGGFFGGYWIDNKIGTVPLFAIIGTFIGATAGIVSLVRNLNRIKTELEDESLSHEDIDEIG